MPAAEIQQHEPDRAADRGVRAKPRAEAAVAAVQADLLARTGRSRS